MKRKKSLCVIGIILLGSIVALFASGQHETKDDKTTVIATDSFNDEVQVVHPLNSIAIVGKAAMMPADALYLFPTAKEMKVTMSKTDQGLGDFFSLIVPKAHATERLGQQVGAEEILRINPELILTKSRNKKDIAPLVAQFNIPLFALDLESMESWKSEIIELGKLLQEEQRAEYVVREISRREEEVVQKVKGEKRPSVLVLQGSNTNNITSFSIAPKNWMQSELVVKAGGKVVTLDEPSGGWSTISFEQIASWNPDYIIIVSYKTKGDSFLHQIYSSSEYKELKAVKEKQVFLAPSDYVNYFQPNSRWILALQWLARTIHPTLFHDSTMSDEVYSFYKEMYGIRDEAVLERLIDLYKASLK